MSYGQNWIQDGVSASALALSDSPAERLNRDITDIVNHIPREEDMTQQQLVEYRKKCDTINQRVAEIFVYPTARYNVFQIYEIVTLMAQQTTIPTLLIVWWAGRLLSAARTPSSAPIEMIDFLVENTRLSTVPYSEDIITTADWVLQFAIGITDPTMLRGLDNPVAIVTANLYSAQRLTMRHASRFADVYQNLMSEEHFIQNPMMLAQRIIRTQYTHEMTFFQFIKQSASINNASPTESLLHYLTKTSIFGGILAAYGITSSLAAKDFVVGDKGLENYIKESAAETNDPEVQAFASTLINNIASMVFFTTETITSAYARMAYNTDMFRQKSAAESMKELEQLYEKTTGLIFDIKGFLIYLGLSIFFILMFFYILVCYMRRKAQMAGTALGISNEDVNRIHAGASLNRTDMSRPFQAIRSFFLLLGGKRATIKPNVYQKDYGADLSTPRIRSRGSFAEQGRLMAANRAQYSGSGYPLIGPSGATGATGPRPSPNRFLKRFGKRTGQKRRKSRDSKKRSKRKSTSVHRRRRRKSRR